MKGGAAEFVFSVPYEMAAVRPLRQTTREERRAALGAACYNTELIAPAAIYVDLKTDSGVSAFSTQQLAKLLGLGPLESGLEMVPEGNAAFSSLSEKFKTYFGFPHVLAVSQGRAAERLWTKLHVKPGSIVPGNMLFPSTRFHIESNGGKVLDVITDAAHDLTSVAAFKGDIDLGKLAAALQEHDGKVACIYVELCVNACGGHPVSLRNLKAVKDAANASNVPLFLDACRILENSYLIKEREPGYENHSVAQIVRETCELADGCTMSALKDFAVAAGGFIATRDEAAYHKAYIQSFLDGVQPASAIVAALGDAFDEVFASDAWMASRVEQVHYLWQRLNDTLPLLQPAGGHGVFIDMARFFGHFPRENFPAEALAAFVFETSGIRLTKGPPPAPSQAARGVELLRMAIPARRYVQGHMDDTAAALLYAYAHKDKIKGLRRIEQAGRAKYAPALFAPLEDC
jgi:tyrosine phenol-lyase